MSPEIQNAPSEFFENMPNSMTRMPLTQAAIARGTARGIHTGVQIYVSYCGEAIADDGIGESRPGVQMTRETLMPWLSAGKPLTAVLVLMLVERGRLSIDTPIAAVIPEFAQGDKGEISVRHALTHTGGFRHFRSNWPHATWDETVAQICEIPLEENWEVGETAGYHLVSSWYILGELIRRIDGRHPADFLREELATPLGLVDTWNGMPHDVWQKYGDRIGILKQRERGTIRDLAWQDAVHCAACSPGGSLRGPVRELGRFYECLLAGGQNDGERVLQPVTVELLTSRHRAGRFDLTFQHVIDFGLGVIVDSKQHGLDTVPYGYGRYCSHRTFGHGGSQCSMGFADPEHELVVAYAANCRAGEGQHQRRNREIIEAIYEDLGLAK